MSKGRTWRNGTLVYTAGGLAVLFLWLMWGDFAYSMKDRATGTVAALMLKKFDVSDFLFGIIMISFPNFTNIFLCPIVSYRSDRHRGRFGRRIPYLLLTTPFIVIGLAGLGFTPLLARLIRQAVGAEHISYNLTALLVFCFFWIILDFGTTLAGAIFNALATDVVPTEFLGRFFAMFRAVSLGCAFLFNYFVMGYAETHALVIFLGLAALYGIGLFSICLKVKEGTYPPVEPEEEKAGGFSAAAKNYFVECFGHPFYRWVILAYVTCGLANIPFNAYTIFYAKSIGVDMDAVGKYLAITYLISLCLSYFLGMLADRFHPLRCGITVMLLYGISCLVSGIFIRGEAGFAAALIAHTVLSGTYFTLTASLLLRLFPQSRFAQYQSAQGILGTLAMIFVVPLIGKLIDLSGNYRLIFYAGALLALLTAMLLFVCYRRFRQYGGPDHYTPPEPENFPNAH